MLAVIGRAIRRIGVDKMDASGATQRVQTKADAAPRRRAIVAIDKGRAWRQRANDRPRLGRPPGVAHKDQAKRRGVARAAGFEAPRRRC